MTRYTTAMTLAGLAMAALVWGCAEQLEPDPLADGIGEDGVDTASLEQALDEVTDRLGVEADGRPGRLDDSDEDPAFGSDALEREFGSDEGDRDVADALDERPDYEYREFYVMAVWGRIRPNDHEPIRLRWDPQLSVVEGDGVHVRKELRFERGDRVHPQTVRNQVQISSATGPHVDGVIAVVRVRLDRDPRAGYLRFRSLPVSVEVPVSDLPDLDQVTFVDRAGNGLLLVALERPVTDRCPNGFMSGRWARTHEAGGVFGGSWNTENGRREGYLAGRWGVTDAGEQVYHGKMIDGAGHFRAFMSGNWGGGHYRGVLFGRDGAEIGRMQGAYAAADEGGHGLFRGVWGMACPPIDPPACDPNTDRLCDRPIDERPDDERPCDPATDRACDRPADERPDEGGTGDRPDDGTTDERPDDGTTDERPDDGTTDERPTDDADATDDSDATDAPTRG